MRDDSFIFNDPSKETQLRWQREKETLGGSVDHGPPPWKEGDRLNDFLLEQLLGSGSSGFVFRVLDIKTNRRCALKLLTDAAPDDLLRNKLGFRRMMSIEHPNLLRVDRIYQLGSNVALSMEEIDGVTLTQVVRSFKSVSPNVAYQRSLELLRDYAAGLAMMHANGYVHRDIKPDNLMVDRQGRGRVIDYGLVDAYELDQTAISSRGFLLGTPHYFAPEVIVRQQYLPAGDIFSLGIVMLDVLRSIHSLAKGKRQAELERSNKSKRDDAERIDEAFEGLSESVPTMILEACREMLEREPSDRPTAMTLSRLGVPHALGMHWPHADPLIGRDAEYREIIEWVEGIFFGKVGRLHLTGPSGIGKSKLIDQVIAHIESKHWGQVFRARCQVREDQPLQAFDQICDEISHRYMKGDRERLELDPVSAGMLSAAFPVLKNVFSSIEATSIARQAEPVDAEEACARMCEQLRLVGPLFLVIDNAQWADLDSLSMLDCLQSSLGREGLGIITISRKPEDAQRLPANQYIHLGPLNREDCATILARAARRWNVDVPAEVLDRLADATGGSPFRVRELADEFRPGGTLSELSDQSDHPSLKLLGQIDQLWQRRAGRLSDDAKHVLTFVVTAGGAVSTQQLGELTGLGDAVDAAVSELARQRLITDEATGGECIAIVHDQIANNLVKTLPVDALTQAHLAWALLLLRSGHPETVAARVAGHYITAGEPGKAVGHAIMAAEDAERRSATIDAARWYAKVVDYLDGAEKIKSLRKAARCYQKADFPLAASDCYRQLSELVDDEERIECQLLATGLLIRSGRFESAREQLSQLAVSVGLPRAKRPWQSMLMLMAHKTRSLLMGRHALLRSVIDAAAQPDSAQPDGAQPDGDETVLEENKSRDKQRLAQAGSNSYQSTWKLLRAIRFGDSLLRPLSLYDTLYAAELCSAASRLSMRYGSLTQKIEFAIGELVLACYDRGRRRIEAESSFLTLKPYIDASHSDFTSGEFWSGIAYSHGLSCRWEQVPQPVELSLQHYQAAGSTYGFEVAHTQFIHLWALWNLGRWNSMTLLSDQLLDNALLRDDLLQQRLTCSGFGAGAFLAADRLEPLERLLSSETNPGTRKDSFSILDACEWIASLQLLLYQGHFSQAWQRFESHDSQLRRFPLSKMQLMRVSRYAIGTLIALHNFSHDFNDTWRLRARIRINQLRRENLSFANVLADLYEGLLNCCVGRHQRNDKATKSAIDLLNNAREQAQDLHLRPFQLVAEDVLSQILNGSDSDRLTKRMKKHGIACPASFRRLYTISDETWGGSFTR